MASDIPGRPAPIDYLAAARVQLRVIGALVLRELHTRFGRNNIGYLWLIVEPMILASGISVVHIFSHVELPFDFQPASFYASGYITYIVFRNNVNRSAGLIESNKPLLYHRQVTLLDISMARSFLEMLATLGAMIIILGFFVLTGLSRFPERPAYILLGIAFMSWLSTAFAMIITGAVELNPLVERFVHPMTYLILPISGMFFVLDQMPKGFSDVVAWFPVPQIIDIVRMGLNGNFDSTYVNYPYIIMWCSVCTLAGLLFLRIARRRMHFE